MVDTILTVPSFSGDPSPFGPIQFFSLVAFILHTFSRGHFHITGPNIDDAVDFDPGLLFDSQGLDVKPHIWMYKKQRKITCHMGLC